MRLLAPVRLSRDSDASTSVQTQTDEIYRYAEDKGHVIVAATEDLNVLGGKPIRKRPGIGPWLADDRLDQWDGIIGYKLDRLFRNHYDYVTFHHDFCEQRGKTIISVGEGIDTSTQMGKFIAGILVQFAEWELARMSERRGDARRRLVGQANWNGGRAPFGYRPERAGNNYILVPDEVNAPIVREMADWIIGGRSATSLAKHLNERGILTGQDKRWQSQQMTPFLRSPRLRGYVTEGPRESRRLVLGDDGMPVRRTPLLEDDTWNKLQAKLDRNADRNPAVHTRASALLGVAFCNYCESPLHADVRSARASHAYYKCQHRRDHGCPARQIPMGELEAAVETWVFGAYGHKPDMEKIVTAGSDHSRQLAEVGQAIAELTQERFIRGIVRGDYDDMTAQLVAEHARLKALPPEPDQIDWRPTGKNVAQVYLDLTDREARRAFLLEREIKVYAWREESENRLQGDVMIRAQGLGVNGFASSSVAFVGHDEELPELPAAREADNC